MAIFVNGARRVAGQALLAAFLLPVGAFAEDCSTLATQMDMNRCASWNYKAVDAELTEVYKDVIARLEDDTAARGMLRDAERAWITFRDTQCAFEASGVTGGSLYPMIQAQCLEAETEARIKTLKGYLACEEGDLSCPVPPQ